MVSLWMVSLMAPMRVAVIGGGAAGFFGAIAAASSNTEVTIFEAGRQVLSKVRISGGGRCNVTHACFEPSQLIQNYPRGGKALRGPLTRFQPRDTVSWYRQRGVKLKTESDGRMFPVTDDSETIVDCLTQTARKAGVRIRTGTPVVGVDLQKTVGFAINLKSGESVPCDRLLLASGSSPQGYRMAKRLGHSIVPPVPSLFTFTIRDPRLEGLAGVSVPDVSLKLTTPDKTKLDQSGPLLVTHWGLSGPAVLKLSAWGARSLYDSRYSATLSINWIPHLKEDSVRQTLATLRETSAKRTITTRPEFQLPKRLWQSLVTAAEIPPTQRWADLSKKALNKLLQELVRGQFQIVAKGQFKDEFVTCGGVELKQVNFKTMESRCCEGLHFAGEVLDIDGVTGGFNFQSAWTTSWIAGTAIANSLS
ncbi:MAG: NAD(P)/FAD-dependent oxidoreductase [Cyanobacteria bacterium J06597_1]